MKQEFTYLWINFFTILFPLLFSFHPKIQFYKKWRFLIPGMVLTAIFFIIWDMIFTRLGIWYFNDNLVTGIKVGNLPLEEILFFITIPYACIFTYETIVNVIKPQKFVTFGKIVFGILLTFLSLGIIIYPDKIYTTVTFSLLLVFFISIKLIIKSNYLHVAFLSYLILLLPFFLVNGYLTGMFTIEAVVFYDNSENMGIRIITIPLEDTFYGLLLFLMNVELFEYFRKNSVSEPKALFD